VEKWRKNPGNARIGSGSPSRSQKNGFVSYMRIASGITSRLSGQYLKKTIDIPALASRFSWISSNNRPLVPKNIQENYFDFRFNHGTTPFLIQWGALRF
jgi:hypothetical protein